MCYSIIRTKYAKALTTGNPEYTECESPEDEARKIDERKGRVEALKIEVFRNASGYSLKQVWDHAPYVPPSKVEAVV